MSKPIVAVRPMYEVVSPVGDPVEGKNHTGARAGGASGKIIPAAPVPDLNGKRIGLVWSAFKNGNVFLEAMESLLAGRFKGLEFVRLAGGRGLRWGDHPHESMAELAREARLDAAIAAAGG